MRQDDVLECDIQMACVRMTSGRMVYVWLYCCLNIFGLANADHRGVLEFGP